MKLYKKNVVSNQPEGNIQQRKLSAVNISLLLQEKKYRCNMSSMVSEKGKGKNK